MGYINLYIMKKQTVFIVALKREKHLKKWNRKWKLELIEKNNPSWKNLYGTLI